MDAHSLELLQFEAICEAVAGQTSSSLGRDLAKALVPSSEPARIRGELQYVSEMLAVLDQGPPPPFSGLHDVRLVIRRAMIGTMLNAVELLDVAETLTCTGAIYRFKMRLDERHEKIIDLLTPVEDLGLVAKSITGCIDGRGHILDGASPSLAAVRQKLFELDESVKTEVRRLLRDPKLREALSYPNATVHGDHYVLPVAVNHRQKIPGVVHRLSATGETVFIEPASIAGLSAERAQLKAEEDREVRKILRRLSQEVGKIAKALAFSIDLIAKLDLITAKAKYARLFGMTVPHLNEERKVWLRNARHPLLMQLALNDGTDPKQKVVPIEVRLGLGFNVLVVTGPNTGGKTVVLKTTGLLSLMTQAGLAIPAGDGSTLPVFDDIFVDIGDEQSLEQSLSTFSSHVTRIASIFSNAKPNSLILLDELGAGTDPIEGAALGRAIIDQLVLLDCRAMVTTHLGDLKTYAFHEPKVENGAVEFDLESLKPTYRLFIGQFGKSNAIQIARRLNLPADLLRRAKKYLQKKRGRTGEINRLQEMRQQAEQARIDALAAQQAAEREREEFLSKTIEIAREATRHEELTQWRSNLKPGETVNVAKFDRAGTVVRVDARKQTVRVSVGLGQWDIPFVEVMPITRSEVD
jgi:DNA mismatch repair protein MutS2